MKQDTNSITIYGEVTKEPHYSHSFHGEKFYEMKLSIKRLSGIKDVLNVIFSEYLQKPEQINVGDTFFIEGSIRTFNKMKEDKIKSLLISVFAEKMEKDNDGRIIGNKAFLEGYICKEPKYRETPLGREITDVLLAVNRKYGKSDYIPCICWGRYARFAGTLPIGTKLKVEGRLQSRDYEKIIDGDAIKKTAYELSISKMMILEEEKEAANEG